MCEAILGSFQSKSFESPDEHTNSKQKTNEEDEIVDVENVDSCDESGSAKEHRINTAEVFRTDIWIQSECCKLCGKCLLNNRLSLQSVICRYFGL